MSDSFNHSIAGGWLGTYHYRGLSAGLTSVRFEAAFTARSEGQFSGSILDDGAGGEARADGVQTGMKVSFTKVYVSAKPGFSLPMKYQGTMSGDGQAMHGTWRGINARGVWEARRVWSEDNRQEMESQQEAQADPQELAAT